eukprot:CAMPEP_0119110324 /NCGR_PEP_ID=MMETSP1180-20130426/28737_1 /TAXON_ID=3052 ORGANISM="Chlamydomonas cf sp, Strain CCMP681" /NCGR_SAMPLE_ID=MMETSP1180 /ASSEMBLY_ACC=CAM_ASM_000741 /LENGTH=154 /DNA_ID=CAMNT_0007096587 /DNA_START=443 /DNA_END=906 /DNA_ORIENTATION=-
MSPIQPKYHSNLEPDALAGFAAHTNPPMHPGPQGLQAQSDVCNHGVSKEETLKVSTARIWHDLSCKRLARAKKAGLMQRTTFQLTNAACHHDRHDPATATPVISPTATTTPIIAAAAIITPVPLPVAAAVVTPVAATVSVPLSVPPTSTSSCVT